MTYRHLRTLTGNPILRQIAAVCGLKPGSLHQPTLLDTTIPTKRRLCLADALEALAANLTNIARELRAEDEP